MECVEYLLWIHTEPFATHHIVFETLMKIGLNSSILRTVFCANEPHDSDLPRITCLKVSQSYWDIIRIANLDRITPVATGVPLSEKIYCHLVIR